MKIERSTQRGFIYCSTVYVHRNEWMITWWMDGYFVRSWMKEDRSFFRRGIPDTIPYVRPKNYGANTSPSLMRPYFDFLRRRSFVLCVVDARLCLFLFLVFVSPQNRQGSSPFPLSICRQQTFTTRQEVSLAVLAFHLLFSINPNNPNSFFSISF